MQLIEEYLGQELEKKIRDRSANVGIIGLGYVGLSLAVEIAKAGFHVTGIDIDGSKVASVNAGVSYIPDVSSETLLSLLKSERIKATQSLAIIENLDIMSICVPTALRKTKIPDLSYVIAAVEAVHNHLHPGQLIILESTTYPGTTRELVLPILEKTGLKVGEDFFLVYSPERVDPGNKAYTTQNIPKVIGGMTPHCGELATLFYQQFIGVIVRVASPEHAEMVKFLENTFRSVNIALANEMALLCHKFGINVWEIIEAAKTKPFGFMAFYPGPGLVDHSVPVDPYYLTWNAKINGFDPWLIEVASSINSQMPAFIVGRVAEALNERQKSLKGSNILALGVTYKGDVNDIRESPALHVLADLSEKGACIYYSDPYVALIELHGKTIKSVDLTPEVLKSMDCIVVLTDHSAFEYEMLVIYSSLILDCRNALKNFSSPNVICL